MTRPVQDWTERVWRLVNQSQFLGRDPKTSALVVVQDEERKAFNGEMRRAEYVFDDISDDADVEMLIRTGANRPTVFFTFASSGSGHIRLYEGATITDEGTEVIGHNRNRNLEGVLDFTTEVRQGHTASADGELIYELIVGGSAGSAGQRRGPEENPEINRWILQPNTDYLMRWTNESGNQGRVELAVDWYENVD